jgi:hypothetical protein
MIRKNTFGQWQFIPPAHNGMSQCGRRHFWISTTGRGRYIGLVFSCENDTDDRSLNPACTVPSRTTPSCIQGNTGLNSESKTIEYSTARIYYSAIFSRAGP